VTQAGSLKGYDVTQNRFIIPRGELAKFFFLPTLWVEGPLKILFLGALIKRPLVFLKGSLSLV